MVMNLRILGTQADSDGSGSITLEEFAEFFCAIRAHLTCTEAQAMAIMKKRPFERGGDEMVRLRNYLASTQPFFQRFTREVLDEVRGKGFIRICLLVHFLMPSGANIRPPLISPLSPTSLQLCRFVAWEEVAAGKWLWKHGDAADRACIIVSGSASVWTHPDPGLSRMVSASSGGAC